MESGANRKRPWEASEAESQSARPAPYQQGPRQRSHRQQSPKTWSASFIDPNRPPTLPPISSDIQSAVEGQPPSYHASQRRYDSTSSPRQGSELLQPASPERRRLSEEQNPDTLACAQWLKSSTSRGQSQCTYQLQEDSSFTKRYSAYSEAAPGLAHAKPSIQQSYPAEGHPRSVMPGYNHPARPGKGPGPSGSGMQQSWCSNCGQYQSLAEEMVSGLALLESELRRRGNLASFQFDDTRRSLQVGLNHMFPLLVADYNSIATTDATGWTSRSARMGPRSSENQRGNGSTNI
jgi:hypothetical protein